MGILLWPFRVIWALIEALLNLTGRMVLVVIGLVFIIIGVLLSLTIVGATAGIPFAILGTALIMRAVF